MYYAPQQYTTVPQQQAGGDGNDPQQQQQYQQMPQYGMPQYQMGTPLMMSNTYTPQGSMYQPMQPLPMQPLSYPYGMPSMIQQPDNGQGQYNQMMPMPMQYSQMYPMQYQMPMQQQSPYMPSQMSQQMPPQQMPPQQMGGQQMPQQQQQQPYQQQQQQPQQPQQPPAQTRPPVTATSGVRTPITGNKRAVIIGINYYDQPSLGLKGCVNDAKNMYKAVTTKYGFNPTDVAVLTDEPGFSGNKPTMSNITTAIEQMVLNAQAGDCFIFTFAGHGSQIPDKSGREADGLCETIICSDYDTQSGANQITDDELYNTLVKPLPEGAKLFCIFDCCHSGSALDLPHFADPPVFRMWKEDVGSLHSACDAVMISGCQDDQTSADGSFKGCPGGALTQSLLNVMSKNEGPITYQELLTQSSLWLKKAGFSQRPNLSSMQEFDLGTEVFDFSSAHPNVNHFLGQEPAHDGKRHRLYGRMGQLYQRRGIETSKKCGCC
eukprot:GHVR01173345.1.p1 GENE.GHVR01173345.1~~GHVR01173345.1.p1  ORF type:complete len:500 (+),score=113.87 GHVR01173345.1:35-1501(+)